MGGPDKLQADLLGWPVLRWSLEALVAAGVDRIVIATSADRIADVAAAPWLPDAVVAVVVGGARRQDSVAAGIAALAESGAAPETVILVHDAARPLATPSLIRAVAEAVSRHGAAIPALPVVETLKRLDGDHVGATIDRRKVPPSTSSTGPMPSTIPTASKRGPMRPRCWRLVESPLWRSQAKRRTSK